jgi:hypothetical protein
MLILRTYLIYRSSKLKKGAFSTPKVEGQYISILVGNLEGRTLVGNLRCKWKENIQMDLRDIRLGAVNWLYQVQNSHQCPYEHVNEPPVSVKYHDILA